MRHDLATTIPELLRLRAAATPDKIAYHERDSEHRWVGRCWNDVLLDVNRLSGFLQAQGFASGDRFLIVGKPSRRWETLHLAILMAGGTVIGVEPHASRDHIQYVIEESNCVWWAVDDRRILESIDSVTRERMKLSLLFDDTGDHPFKCCLWKDAVTTEPCCDFPTPQVTAQVLATVIYTSGTTGKPKALSYSHEQLLAACQSILIAFPQIREGDNTLCWLPLAHLFQRMMNLVAMARGVTVYFVDDPHKVVECAQEVEPAIFFGVPRFYEKLYAGIQQSLDESVGWRKRVTRVAVATGRAIRVADSAKSKSTIARLKFEILDRIVLRKIRAIMGSRMRFMITGSAPMPTHILDFFHSIGWPLLEAYGVSENTIPMSANRLDDFRVGSVGKPLTSNELRFESDGEILVRGPGVFRGYEGDVADDDCITLDGFYRTGDIGHLDEDGFLHLTGRKSDFIKTSTGRKISPARVELHYMTSRLLETVVVFGDNQSHLAALVVPNRDRLASILVESDVEIGDSNFYLHPKVGELLACEIETLGCGLPHYERVSHFAILPEPFSIARGELTPTLKIRRQHIAEQYAGLIKQLHESREIQTVSGTGSGLSVATFDTMPLASI